MNSLAKLYDRLAKAKSANFPPRQSRAFETGDITGTIDRALDAAGLQPDAGPAVGVRATIERALAQAGLGQPASIAIDRAAPDVATDAGEAPPARDVHALDLPAAKLPAAGGTFVGRSFTNAAGTRAYKLYVPLGYAGERDSPVPLIVMLHGCTQSPDDFAAGTRMNALADEHGFLVAYPAQTANANGSKCWNWFRPQDQARERGEPALIAGIARAVAADYRIDARRVFVAGLSAGAAMAVILGETYPEVFAAVGAHSGLPMAAAHDVPSAFNAMKGGAGTAGLNKPAVRDPNAVARAAPGVPTIVFHGDRDVTVAPLNGLAIVRQATAGTASAAALRTSSQQGKASGGRAYTREVVADATGRPLAEHWVVHGAGHAWSGGSAEGSYTDPAGPDASAEMVRFFLQQRAGRG